MATVYLDPLKLETKIIQLETFCANARTAANFDIKSQYKNDPVKSGGGLSPHITAIVNAAYVLDGRAVEIRANKTKIQQLSSNGLAITEGQGRIRLEVPDDSDALNDSSKFQKWAQASLDAIDLKRAEEGHDENKRNEIIQRIEQNKTDHTYASAFVDRYGVENVILLPGVTYSNEPGKGVENTLPDPKLTALSASLLSNASQTWGAEKSKQVSDRIRGWLNEANTQGRATRLNSVLSVSDAYYGRTFLGTLANTLDDDPWDERLDDAEHRGFSDSNGYTLRGYSTDPVAAVINAMKNVPDAALDYALPEGNLEDLGVDERLKIKERVTQLMNRHRIDPNSGPNEPHKQSWIDTWSSIMADTSSKYGGENGLTVDRVNAARAALLCSAGVEWISETPKISGGTRSNVATVLRNYAYSVDKAASSEQSPGSTRDPVKFSPDEWDFGLKGVPPQAAFDRNRLNRVIGMISEDEKEFAKVVEGVGVLNGVRMRDAADMLNSNPVMRSKIIDRMASSRGYLIGSAHAHKEKGAVAEDERNDRIIRLVTGLTSFIPGLKEGVGQMAKSSYSYLQAQASAEVGSAARDQYVSNLANVKANNDEASSVEKEYLNADIIKSMVDTGAYSLEQLEAIYSSEQMKNVNLANLSASNPEIRARTVSELNSLGDEANNPFILDLSQKQIYDSAKARYEEAYARGLKR